MRRMATTITVLALVLALVAPAAAETSARVSAGDVVGGDVTTASTPVASAAISDACPPGRVPPSGFADIDGNPHEASIDCVAFYGIAGGVGDNRYAPRAAVTRDAMATFVAELIDASEAELPAASDQGFTDIAGNTHEDNINRLAAAGVVSGQRADTYGSRTVVTRDAMATFLVGAYSYVTGEELVSEGDNFDDTAGNTHEDSIDAAAEAGFASGTGERTYDPRGQVLRDAMATFVMRTGSRLVREGEMEVPEADGQPNAGDFLVSGVPTEDGQDPTVVWELQYTLACDGGSVDEASITGPDLRFYGPLLFAEEDQACTLTAEDPSGGTVVGWVLFEGADPDPRIGEGATLDLEVEAQSYLVGFEVRFDDDFAPSPRPAQDVTSIGVYVMDDEEQRQGEARVGLACDDGSDFEDRAFAAGPAVLGPLFAVAADQGCEATVTEAPPGVSDTRSVVYEVGEPLRDAGDPVAVEADPHHLTVVQFRFTFDD